LFSRISCFCSSVFFISSPPPGGYTGDRYILLGILPD
jgi:hypothetical protein